MEHPIRLMVCALLLAPAMAFAQEEEPAVEEIPAEEPAAVEEVPPIDAPDEAAAGEAPIEEIPVEESASSEVEGGWFDNPRGHVDGFAVARSRLHQLTGGVRADEEGDGAGARGLLRFGKHLAVSGEYTTRDFDDIDVSFDEMRVGLGLMLDSTGGDTLGLFAEYNTLESDEVGDLDGYSAHLRLSRQSSEWFGWYGDLGYLMLQDEAQQDFSGPEFTLGALFSFGQFGVFADLRRSTLYGRDSDDQFAFTDVRAGVRFSFGASAL
jgi:hypothetical protein